MRSLVFATVLVIACGSVAHAQHGHQGGGREGGHQGGGAPQFQGGGGGGGGQHFQPQHSQSRPSPRDMNERLDRTHRGPQTPEAPQPRHVEPRHGPEIYPPGPGQHELRPNVVPRHEAPHTPLEVPHKSEHGQPGNPGTGERHPGRVPDGLHNAPPMPLPHHPHQIVPVTPEQMQHMHDTRTRHFDFKERHVHSGHMTRARYFADEVWYSDDLEPFYYEDGDFWVSAIVCLPDIGCVLIPANDLWIVYGGGPSSDRAFRRLLELAVIQGLIFEAPCIVGLNCN